MSPVGAASARPANTIATKADTIASLAVSDEVPMMLIDL